MAKKGTSFTALFGHLQNIGVWLLRRIIKSNSKCG